MSEYSRLEESMRRREEQLALDALYAPVKPWTKAESSRAATDARRAAVRSSFAEFDRLYFPAEVHDDYAPPVPEFHGTIAADCFRRSMECTLILGPHNHAKSATVYKALIYCALTGAKHFVGIVSETLETPTEILRAVGTYLQTNDRIKHDYPDLRVPRFNAEELRVTTDDNPRGTVYKCFSEWKSPRGKNVNLFQRFDLIAIEDLENQMSAFDAQAVERRNAKLAEYQAALAGDGCLVWTANNLHPQCLANRKKIEYEQGLTHFDAQGTHTWWTSLPRPPRTEWHAPKARS